MTQSEWESIPEHEKEEALHAQRVEKWVSDLFDMWKHFNRDRVEALNEITQELGGYDDLVWRDFQKAMRTAKGSVHKGAKTWPLIFFAKLCNVSKSTISRYHRFHGAELVASREQVSQREAESFTGTQRLIEIFDLYRDNDADFSKVGELVNGLRLGMHPETKKNWRIILGMWLEDQAPEIQERIEKQLGIYEWNKRMRKLLDGKTVEQQAEALKSLLGSRGINTERMGF